MDRIMTLKFQSAFDNRSCYEIEKQRTIQINTEYSYGIHRGWKPLQQERSFFNLCTDDPMFVGMLCKRAEF